MTTTTKRDPAVTRELILAACSAKLDEIQARHDSIPRQSVWERKAEFANHDCQEIARRQMAAHHRAAQELMFTRVLQAARCTVWSIQDSPMLSSLEKAKGFLQCAVRGYKEQTVRFPLIVNHVSVGSF